MAVGSYIPNYDKNRDENIRMLLDEVYSIPLLTYEEEKELTNLYYETHDNDVKKKLIESNLRLVVHIASYYCGYNLEFLDLVQEGNLGLIEGIERFNPTKGCKLSTYIFKTIRSKILDYIYVTSNPYHIPIYHQQDVFEYQKNKDKLYKLYGSSISLEEIANYLNIPFDKVVLYEQLSKEPLSIYQKIGIYDERYTLEEITPNENIKETEDTVVDNLILDDISKALGTLSDKKRLYIMLRYGLYDGIERTLKETAIDLYKLGINDEVYSEEAINRTIKDSFKKISKSKYLRGYQEYL